MRPAKECKLTSGVRSFSLRAQRKATPKVCSAKKARFNFRNSGIECHHDSVPVPIVEAPAAQAEKTKNLGKISTMLEKFSGTRKSFPDIGPVFLGFGTFTPNFGVLLPKVRFFSRNLVFFYFPMQQPRLAKKAAFCWAEGLYASVGESRERAWL